MSKLRYGLQLCNTARTKTSDPTNKNMQAAQIAPNKMLRMLNGSTLKDHISTNTLLEKFNLPSVNQLAAEIKLTEAWKIMNVPDYPISLDSNNPQRDTGDRIVRGSTTRQWKEHAKYKNSRENFNIDTARLWNLANNDIKNADTLKIAKTKIKNFCKTLAL